MNIAIINGPNLNLLGKREPNVYGDTSFDECLEELRKTYPEINFSYYQSNVEGELVNAIQELALKNQCIVLNAASYTHTSIAIGDAVAAIDAPVVEIHISNIYQRESFRQHSYIAAHSKGVISGFGLQGYKLAVQACLSSL